MRISGLVIVLSVAGLATSVEVKTARIEHEREGIPVKTFDQKIKVCIEEIPVSNSNSIKLLECLRGILATEEKEGKTRESANRILTPKENDFQIKGHSTENVGTSPQDLKCDIATREACILAIPNSEEQERQIQAYILGIQPSDEQKRQILKCQRANSTSNGQDGQDRECERANVLFWEQSKTERIDPSSQQQDARDQECELQKMFEDEVRELSADLIDTEIQGNNRKIQELGTDVTAILPSKKEDNVIVDRAEVFSNYSFLNLTSVKQSCASDLVKRLNFSHNNLKSITKLKFSSCGSLEILDLSYNLIDNIEHDAFQNFYNLIFLDLSFNSKLQTLPKLPHALKVLKIHGTSITSTACQLLKYLTDLSLTDKALEIIRDTRKLEHLHIHIEGKTNAQFKSRTGLGHLISLKISQEYTSDKLFYPRVLSTLTALIPLSVDNLHLEGVFHWMDAVRLLREISCSSISNITLSGVFRWFPNCVCDGCQLDNKLCSNVSGDHKNVSNQALSVQLKEQTEAAYLKEGNIMNSLFLLHLSTVLTKYNRNLIRLNWSRKFIDLCSSVENSVLDLSSGKISNSSSWNEEFPLPNCSSLDTVTYFNISNNNLKINLASLMSIVNIMKNVSRMDASHNRMYFSEGNRKIACGFKSKQLLFLNISHNPLTTLGLLCIPSSVEELDLSFTNISKISKEIFESLPNLVKLYLRGNSFVFQLKQCFGGLDIYCAAPYCWKANMFTSMIRSYVTTTINPIISLPNNITHLDIRNSSIVDLPEFFADDFPHLQHMNLSDNDIPSLPCFKSPLLRLEINNNKLRRLPMCLKNLSNLTVLTIRNNKMDSINVTSLPLTLEQLDLSGNQIAKLPADFGESMRELKSLDISRNQVTELNCTNLPSGIVMLDASNNLISSLPGDFERLSKLESLILSVNKISYLQPGSLPTSLLRLDVSRNALTTITEETFSRLSNLRNLDFEGNSFFCNCDLYWFANDFVHRSHLKEAKGWDNVQCSFPHEKRGQKAKDCGLSLLHCAPALQVAIAMAGAVILTLLVTGLCWRYDGLWYVKMGWYWCMAKRSVYGKRPENKQYDAFVSYSEEDAGWVKECLVRQLESEGFKICYHERDFKPGHPILGNIFNCIENSHKVVFVLSTSFVTSCWCQYELYFAEHRILNENEDSLIMVVLEELPPHTVPQKFSKLRKLLNRKTYLKWSSEEHKQAIFWHQLTTVLKTTNEPIV